MAEKDPKYTIDEIGLMLDRIERKLDLILFSKDDYSKRRFMDFDCREIFECPRAGYGCWYCKYQKHLSKL